MLGSGAYPSNKCTGYLSKWTGCSNLLCFMYFFNSSFYDSAMASASLLFKAKQEYERHRQILYSLLFWLWESLSNSCHLGDDAQN
jgi:hypothetical protein